MKYKTALAAVFAKYRNPRTRTCALALLERYGEPARPVTAWHAVGEDADASKLLLEGLGFSEKEHFTVQRSVLDPGAARISWTEAGLALVARMAAELQNWDGAGAQRRVLTPGAGDPLELVPDVEAAASDSPAPHTDGFTSKVLEMTEAVAKAVIGLSYSNEATSTLDAKTFEEVLAWAKSQDDGADGSIRTPVAPLAVAEALARMRGNVPGMPSFQVFDAEDAKSAACGWQASRPMGLDDGFPAAGRVNLMPLAEQKGSCGQLDGYFAWNVSQWRKFPESDAHRYRCVWTQFDARIRRTADALQFALDADRMRRFASAVMDAAYPGLSCGLVSTTRLAVGNTALGGAPGNECLEDDNGDTSQLQYRIDDSAFPCDAPVYMGAHLLVAGHCDAGVEWTCETHPVEIATGDPEEDAAACGVRADEIADEWFLVVHGGAEEAWPHRNETWRPAPDRRKAAERNLPALRAFVGENLRSGKDRLLDMCEPTSPVFNRLENGNFTVEGSFVNGVAAAMRHYAPDGIEFVHGSPFFPDKIFAGVWSGIGTDLAPARVEEAAEAEVFPNLASFSFGSYVKTATVTGEADAFVKLMRDRPDIQFRYGKRTSGIPRHHTIVLETNVSARKFVERISAADGGSPFLHALWRTFYTSFVVRRDEPLASIDESFSALGGEPHTLMGFREWVNLECPDWTNNVTLGLYGKLPPRGFHAGWLEDSLGRLIIVFWSANPNLTLRVKTAWRYAHSLPVPSAAYLVKAGRTKAVRLTPDMTDAARYEAVLKAAMGQEGFVHDCELTVGSQGVFGTAWIKDAVWDMDADEVPSRDWYMRQGCAEQVGSYATPF